MPSMGEIWGELGLDTSKFVKGTKTAKKATGELDKSATQLGKNPGFLNLAKGAALAGGALVIAKKSLDFMTSSLEAYSEQVDSVNALNLALANQGNLLPGTSARLQDYASSLQKITVFGDETILKNQALLASFGMNEAELRNATSAALDFASATGRDLNMAVNLLGKAFVGETGELSRYGIIIDKSIPKTERFAEVMTQLNQRFGGAAQLATETYTGKTKQLSNAFGDLQEQVGKLINFMATGAGAMDGMAGVFDSLSKAVDVLVISIGEANALQREAKAVADNAAASYLEWWTFLPLVGDSIGKVSEHLRGNAAALNEGAAATREYSNEVASTSVQAADFSAQQEAGAANALRLAGAERDVATNTAHVAAQLDAARANMLALDIAMNRTGDETFPEFGEKMVEVAEIVKPQFAQIEAAGQRMGATTRAESTAAAQQMRSDFETMAASGKYSYEEVEKAAQKLHDLEVELGIAKVDAQKTQSEALIEGGTALIGALGQKYKAAAIAGATINTFQAIAKANAAYPWPASIVPMAAAGVLGAMQVSRISGSSPGFAGGTPGLDYQNFGSGTDATLHGTEAVVPQNKTSSLARDIAMALGNSGGTTAAGASMTMNVYLDAGGREDADSIFRELIDRLRRNQGQIRDEMASAIT